MAVKSDTRGTGVDGLVEREDGRLGQDEAVMKRVYTDRERRVLRIGRQAGRLQEDEKGMRGADARPSPGKRAMKGTRDSWWKRARDREAGAGLRCRFAVQVCR